MMLHHVRFLKTIAILLTLLGLLVGASYAQEPRPYHDALGQAVIHLQPGVGIHRNDQKEYKLYGFVDDMPPEGSFIGTWVVNGVSFVATDSTKIKEDDEALQDGAYVKVKYYVSGDVNYATDISTKNYNDKKHKFYGFVEDMPEGNFIGTWMISGLQFETTDSTEFEETDGPLEVDAYVKVRYYISGTVNCATEIETKDYYVPNQVVARLQPGVDIEDIHSDYNTWAVNLLTEQVYLLGLEPESDVPDTVGQMDNDPRIVYAEPNLIGEVPEAAPFEIGAWAGYDPAPCQAQYANEHLDLPLARDLSTGSGVVVAVLDTGAQLDHPDLAPHLTDGYDFVDDDPVPADEGNGLDDDGDSLVDEATGHGTHVAGIVLLVAPQSQIMPLRVLDSDGLGNAFQVAQAMIYATDHGAQVLNLSLGTSLPSNVLLEGINYARSAGVMVVAAAGNLNSTEPQYPAANEGVIAVAALDEQRLKTSFSNYGSWVDLAAPGESIYSTYPIDGYGWWSGTSMATPFVSGQIALLRSLAPWLTLAQIEGQLETKARNLDTLNPDYAGQLGAGEPDVAASLGCHWADVEPDATHDLLNNTCDDDVDIADVMAVAVHWGQPQPPGSAYDNDHDGDVDVVDVMRVASYWSWTRQ